MANESSEDSGGMAIGAANWEQPDGLGWQLWRRAQTTGLLTQPIQRQLARSRAVFLRDLVPLATAIRRRWATGENSRAAWSLGDLPFFLGRFSFPRERSEHLSMPRLTAARRFVNASPVSSDFAIARSPEAAAGTLHTAAGAGDAAHAMVAARQNAGDSDSFQASPVARRVDPAPAQATVATHSGIDSRADSANTARHSLAPPVPMTTVRTIPVSRGTAILFRAIAERHIPLSPSLRRSDVNSLRTESRIRSALMQRMYEGSAPLVTAARGGMRTSEQGSRATAATAQEYRTVRVSRAELPAATPPGGPGEKNTSPSSPAMPIAVVRAVERAPSSAGSGSTPDTAGGETSAQGYDEIPGIVPPGPGAVTDIISRSPATGSPVGMGQEPITVPHPMREEPDTVPPAHGAGATVSRTAGARSGMTHPNPWLPGGAIAGMILRSLWRRPAGGAPLGLPAAKLTSAQIFTRLGSGIARSFGARGILATQSRATLRIATARAQEIGVGGGASSASPTGLVEREIFTEPQPRPVTPPTAKPEPNRESSAATLVASAPAREIVLTAGAAAVAAQNLIGRETFGSQQLRTVEASDDRRPTADARGAGGEKEVQTVRAWPLGGVNDFTAARTMPGFASPMTPLVSRLAAMPLSIAPVLKGGVARTGVPAVFTRISAAPSRKITRAAYRASARADGADFGGESAAGISTVPGGGLEALRTREAPDSTLGLFPSRGFAEAASGDGNATSMHGGTPPAQLQADSFAVVNAHPPSLGIDGGIFRAAADFGAIYVPRAGGNPQGWSTLHQGFMSSAGIPWNRSLIQRAARAPAAPLFIARTADSRAAVGDQPLGVTTPEQPMRSADVFSSGWIPGSAVSAVSEFHSQTAGAVAALLLARHLAMAAPTILRRSDFRISQDWRATAPATGETSYAMPLAALTIGGEERGRTVGQRVNGTAIQTAPQLPVATVPNAVAISEGGTTRSPNSQTDAAKPQVDLDTLVEKTWQKLLRKLTIERERRGYTRWA
ncbi:MAG TPA: hypothetical protein VIH18_36925 [Candidatus Binatia bacterium]